MFVMLFTAFWIMQSANRAKLNLIETITLRGGYSIYAGWMISATTLSTIWFFNNVGVAQPKQMPFDQGEALARILWVCQPIFMILSFYEKNPLFGSVFVWTIIGMHTKHANPDTPEYNVNVTNNTTAILIYFILFLVLSTANFIKEKRSGKLNRGLFY